MKKLNAFLVSVFATVALNAAVIEQVIVRQQWPWSTDVKVEYKLKDVTSPVDIAVKAYNGDVELPIPEAAISGARYGVSDVVGTIVIDPVAAFGTAKVALANFKVKLTITEAPASRTEVLYKIIDIDANPVTVTDVTRADILNGKYGTYETDYSVFSSFGRNIPGGYPDVTYSTTLSDVLVWTGVTNGDLYRTSKLALRKIPAAGKSFGMGVWKGTKIDCSFTKDFWIGVFPVTQYQLHRFLPDYVCNMSNRTYVAHALRVADGLSWNTVRGDDGTSWPYGTHANVGRGSFFNLFQSAVGNKRYDLPTEAQWEFAARGGSDAMFPHGFDMTGVNPIYYYCYFGRLFMTPSNTDANSLDRNSMNNAEGAYPPGQYAPNAYGLYDVMGNVKQFCLDRADSTYSGRGGTDARGSASDVGRSAWGGMCRIVRGGSYLNHFFDVGSVDNEVQWVTSGGAGFRLCLHEED